MRTLAYLILVFLVGCSSQAGPAPANASRASTVDQIKTMIGNASCTDSSQCHSLPIGARACGGPQGYLAWSSAQTNGDELKALAERYKAERQAEIKQKREVSDCRFLMDTGAVCNGGTCQAGSALPEREYR